MKDYRLVPAQHKKKIIVVGGGIGGMEVARLCALRGHEVTLYERVKNLVEYLLQLLLLISKKQIKNCSNGILSRLQI